VTLVNSNAKWIVAALLTCTVAVGCNSNKKKEGAMAMQPSSLDVPAAPVASTAGDDSSAPQALAPPG